MHATSMHLSSVVYVTTFASVGVARLAQLPLSRAVTPSPSGKRLFASQLCSLVVKPRPNKVQIVASRQPCRGLRAKNGDNPLLRAQLCFH
jgi:hypothetical protein